MLFKEAIEPAVTDPQTETENPGYETSRNASLITLARIEDYKELWAETGQKGDDLFLQKTRELWKELVVHGAFRTNPEKETVFLERTDLDGRVCVGLMREAGINTSYVKYVVPGEYEEGAINMDTGNQQGLVVKDGGATAFMDHHGESSKNDSSGAAVVYETLISLGLLERTESMDALIEFVTQVDNRTFPNEENLYVSSYHTVLGLSNFIGFPELLEYFKAGRKPTETLSNADLEKYHLTNGSERQKKAIDKDRERLKIMAGEGLVVNTARHGIAIIDIGKTVKGGFGMVRALKCGCYVLWEPKTQSFFVSTEGPLEERFPQGKKIRETMWIKPRNDNEPLHTTLAELLQILGADPAAAKGALKEFLASEGQDEVPKEGE